MTAWRWLLIGGLLTLSAVRGHRAVGVWQNERALWANAYAIAPEKSRVRHNYAQALWLDGEIEQAKRVLSSH